MSQFGAPGDSESNKPKQVGPPARKKKRSRRRKKTREDLWKDLRGKMYPDWPNLTEDAKETLERNFEVNYFISIGTNKSIPSTATSGDVGENENADTSGDTNATSSSDLSTANATNDGNVEQSTRGQKDITAISKKESDVKSFIDLTTTSNDSIVNNKSSNDTKKSNDKASFTNNEQSLDNNDISKDNNSSSTSSISTDSSNTTDSNDITINNTTATPSAEDDTDDSTDVTRQIRNDNAGNLSIIHTISDTSTENNDNAITNTVCDKSPASPNLAIGVTIRRDIGSPSLEINVDDMNVIKSNDTMSNANFVDPFESGNRGTFNSLNTPLSIDTTNNFDEINTASNCRCGASYSNTMDEMNTLNIIDRPSSSRNYYDDNASAGASNYYDSPSSSRNFGFVSRNYSGYDSFGNFIGERYRDRSSTMSNYDGSTPTFHHDVYRPSSSGIRSMSRNNYIAHPGRSTLDYNFEGPSTSRGHFNEYSPAASGMNASRVTPFNEYGGFNIHSTDAARGLNASRVTPFNEYGGFSRHSADTACGLNASRVTPFNEYGGFSRRCPDAERSRNDGESSNGSDFYRTMSRASGARPPPPNSIQELLRAPPLDQRVRRNPRPSTQGPALSSIINLSNIHFSQPEPLPSFSSFRGFGFDPQPSTSSRPRAICRPHTSSRPEPFMTSDDSYMLNNNDLAFNEIDPIQLAIEESLKQQQINLN